MFLAHFSGTPLNVLLDMPSNELREWFDEAMTLHKLMNRTE
jgi:hypothetical protein